MTIRVSGTVETVLHQIPGYVITEQLYAGSRTIVYRAIETANQRRVVIKLLRSEFPTFEEVIQFRNQYAIAKHLDLAGVVKLYGLDAWGNRDLLVMEDFGGISLDAYLKQSNRLSVERFLSIALQLVETLDDLHRDRIVHKDLKPSNILIHPKTHQVKLIDFSIATSLPREIQENPSGLRGTLAYIAPEQTGRMNRGIDYRSDFYSLGVTFYELLTGQLPFQSEDPIELVYSHIAVTPIAADQINPEIPTVLSALVAKLMAKNAEDRYQSASGIRHDLERCCIQWQQTQAIESFELGERDISDRFVIPEKLYGRAEEVQQLLAAFDRISNDSAELMLIAGFSGIGKTAVVNEIHKPLCAVRNLAGTGQRGYLIKGKFDQFNRNIPFSAFVQALRSLVGQLLSESDEQLARWRTNIMTAIAPNGQTIVDVLPELEQIIGQQPAVAELSGSAAQQRFNALFRKFIQVFTQPAHPLVIFLDDLQWADSASIELLKLLMTDSRHLLIIGAYRDQEVSPVHPFRVAVEEMEQAGATVNTIALQALSQTDINQLVADTLSCDPVLAQPLTDVLYQQAKGNPFFTAQSLKALHEAQLIQFDQQNRYWKCNISEIKAQSLSDDVVEFMAQQLQKLPIETQETLKLAACIGAQFDVRSLSVIQKISQTEASDRLWKALQEGLILPNREVYKFFRSSKETATAEPLSYRFLHDRVQQAAYSLIPSNQKQAVHLQIGRLLLAENRSHQLFNIVNQLNLGRSLIEDAERDRVAQLNLEAAQKARASTAYRAAFVYAQTGIELVRSTGWQYHYSTMLQLHNLAAETAFLVGDFEQVSQIREAVLNKAKSLLDRVFVEETQIQAYCAQKQYEQAVSIGLQILKQLGIALPMQPSPLSVKRQLSKTKNLLRGFSTEALFALPKMQTLDTIAALRIMELLLTAAFFVSRPLAMMIPLVGIQKSLVQGNCNWSSSFYSFYSFVLSGSTPIEACYQAGQVALEVLNQCPNPTIEGKVKILVAYFSQLWGQPLRNSLPLLRSGTQAAINAGDPSYVAMGYCTEIWTRFCLGDSIGALLTQVEVYRQAVIELKDQQSEQILTLLQPLLLNFVESSPQPHSLIGLAFDETQIIAQCQASKNSTILASIYAYKAWLAYWFNDRTVALEYANLQVSYEQDNLSNCMIVLRWWFDALIRLAAYPGCDRDQRKILLKQITANQRKLQHRADHNPIDFQHKCDLLNAERNRVLGRFDQAMQDYDQAIALAKKNKYVQDEALANELAARFYLDRGKAQIAQHYLIDAYYAYARWGAKAKVEDLQRRYPNLLTPILQKAPAVLKLNSTLGVSQTIATSTQTATSSALDFTTIFKLSQALSSEIDLAQLIERLLRIVVEHAGANRCVLLLHEEEWIVKAVAQTDETGSWDLTLSAIVLDQYPDLPLSLIRSVKRSLKPTVIANATAHALIAVDPYILRQKPKSVLCLPVLHQAKPLAILYLENQVTIDAFTHDRLEILNLLCSQAAISLENARLYQRSQQALEALQQTQLQLVQNEKMSALGNLVAGVAHEINNPIGFLSGNINPALNYVSDLFELLDLYQAKYSDDDIQAEIEAIDLAYIREDLPKLIDSMQEGVRRIQDISTSLRTFSRADADRKQPFDIHAGLDSTVLILKHRLKANQFRPEIEVIKRYANLPLIDCFPGQLNQVFMNILANAIDALEESNQGRTFADIKTNPNRITITTAQENDQAIIQIQDNGIGMIESVKQKVFDHLFTTKTVGKGTGLGLAIARQIVIEKHGGTIVLNSAPHQGTEFVIQIPILEQF